jgi:hypothetical protein
LLRATHPRSCSPRVVLADEQRDVLVEVHSDVTARPEIRHASRFESHRRLVKLSLGRHTPSPIIMPE